MNWATRAACRAEDPELFFPIAERSHRSITAAKRVCAHCTVLDACRAYALRAGEPAGVWGGLTVQERRDLRAPSTAAAHHA